MKTLYVSITALLIFAMFGLAVVGTTIPSALAEVQATDQSNIAVELTALEQTNGVRYSVTIINPSDVPLPGMYALVVLSPGVNLVQALETDGYTHFLGMLPAAQGVSLLWAANFNTGDYVDAFTFTLDGPAVGNIGVNLTWAGDNPGHVAFYGQPSVSAGSLLENDLALNAAGTGDALVPVGGTGVLVGAAPGQVPDGTKIHVRLMNADENPPETGDLWWCSAVNVTGLPAGAEITVLAPLRQPLPPGAPVTLFMQQGDGTWTPLADPGIVTFDGQHVAYAHHGGAVATGIQNKFQPTLPKAPLHPTPVPPPRIPPTNPPKGVTPLPPTPVKPPPPPPIKITRLPPGTPPRIASFPTNTATPPVIRATRQIPPLVPAVVATKTPVAATKVASATIGAKPNVSTPTVTAAPSCVGVANKVCIAPGGGVTVISLCARAGANCISNGNNGTICFKLTPGGALQCAAPGSTVLFKPGDVKPNTGSLQLLGSATPVVVIVTATFLPQPTICVQDTSGNTACTNPNGQFVEQPTATPFPTATLRADGGVCFVEQLPNTTDAAAIVQICVDATGHECITGLLADAFAQAFGGSAGSVCLNPNDPGYIPPP